MNMKRLVTLLLLVVIIGMLVGPITAQENKIATIIYPQELDNLNRMYTSMWFAAITRDFVLSPAITFDGDLNPVPRLLTEVPSTANGGINEDGTVITMKLRDDIQWSDGEPITSADFVFTYDMLVAEGNTPISRFPYDTKIESVEAPDETTVVITFTDPFAPWMTSVFTYVLPEHVLGPVFDEEGTIDDAAWNREPTVGSGPFVFSEWESGSHILFTRNENYFDEPAKLDGIFIRFVEDDAAMVNALLNGDGDMATFIAYSDLPQLEEVGLTPQFVSSGYNEAWFLNLNPETNHPAMNDVRVRQALILGFDRELITTELMLDRTYPANTYWEGTPFSNPDVKALPYDPEAAAALLDEAGWVDSDGDGVRDKDGVKLELRYLTPPRQVRMDTQVVAQQELAEIGVSLILENPSYDIFWNSYAQDGPIATGQFDIAEWSQNTYFPDPDTSDFLCSEIPSEDKPEGNNWTHWCNDEAEALFTEQARTVDFEARQQLFFRIAELMADDAVWAGVWYDPDVWVVSSKLTNTAVNGANPYWNANEWDMTE